MIENGIAGITLTPTRNALRLQIGLWTHPLERAWLIAHRPVRVRLYLKPFPGSLGYPRLLNVEDRSRTISQEAGITIPVFQVGAGTEVTRASFRPLADFSDGTGERCVVCEFDLPDDLAQPGGKVGYIRIAWPVDPGWLRDQVAARVVVGHLAQDEFHGLREEAFTLDPLEETAADPEKAADAREWLTRLLDGFEAGDPRAAAVLKDLVTIDTGDIRAGGDVAAGSHNMIIKIVQEVLDAEQIDRVRAVEVDPIDAYLTKTLPDHLSETGSLELPWLEKTFVDLAATVREQRGIDPVLLDPDLDDDAFVPRWDPGGLQVELSGELHAPAESTAQAPQQIAHTRERLRTLRRVVLLGEPGAGKTFLLARLALDYREAYPHGPLPVFVPLSAYDTAQDFATFAAGRLGPLAGRLPDLDVIWLLDALNEMPRGKGQWPHLQHFIERLVVDDVPFVVSCRVRNYEEELRHIPGLHRVDLQDLNPRQIHDILTHFLGAGESRDIIWREALAAGGLLPAWKAWQDSVRAFWQRPDSWRWDEHERVRAGLYRDPRRLALLARNPFNLVRLLVPRMRQAVRQAGRSGRPLQPLLEQALPGNRAQLFGEVIEARLAAEADRRGWGEADIERIVGVLEHTAAALQASEQRTVMAITSLDLTHKQHQDLIHGRDAGLVTLGEDSVRFNHQLFQEYFATKRLRDLLADYTTRHPGWEAGPALPPRDEHLTEIMPQWWEPGGWRVTVSLLGELAGRTGIGRVVRWLASYTPEVALDAVRDNNDGLQPDDLPEAAQQALVDGAHRRTPEANPVGRAAAYRVLGYLSADNRSGVALTDDGLPDIVWVDIPAGAVDIKGKSFEVKPFRMAQYPVTYAQYRAFVEADDGFHNPQWWEGLAASDDHKAQPGEQYFPFDNHPAEMTSWWDAVAFCRWLSSRTGLDIRLPTEWEWQWAAQGDTGWAYPYGPKFDAAKANVDATGIGQTSAVGIFPQGAAQHWGDAPDTMLMDLSGNVWELCLNEYDTPENTRLGGGATRALRGGSFVDFAYGSRAGDRYLDDPYFRFRISGFRLACNTRG